METSDGDLSQLQSDQYDRKNYPRRLPAAGSHHNTAAKTRKND